MTAATQLITSFLGGEISQFAQGRYDKPDYRTSMRVCLNAFPTESGSWTRRPGTVYASHTKGGAPGRKIKFDFEQSTPVTMEFTDSTIRFRVGATLISTNDVQTVVAVSAANPAVVQVSSAVNWATGDTLIFPGASTPLLEARQFTATKIDTTHFSLADALTGVTINGASLGALVAGAMVERVHEVATSYVGSAWSTLRAVQAETTSILLSSGVPPQALTASTLPTAGINPQFSLAQVVFNDGPYLDPFTNGVQINPGGTSGVIQFTLSFPAYDATKSYGVGAFVTSSSVNYKSLIDQNVGNTPASTPSAWQATSAGAAINNGQGFLGSDIGRLVRFFSEPALWDKATTYSSGNVVAYNPSNTPGASTYWQALAGSTNKPPGTDITNWQLVAQATLWTWGKIVGFSNAISGTLSGSLNIGSMTDHGGLAAGFDGVTLKASSAAAAQSMFGGGPSIVIDGYIGKNYTGASTQQVASATVYPSSDLGFAHGFITGSATLTTLTVNLRAKSTAPSTPSDGTLLGTVTNTGNTTTAISVPSSDQVTAWNYVWVEIVATWNDGGIFPAGNYFIYCAQAQFFNPTTSSSSSNSVSIELLGPALLYTAPIRNWRLGVFTGSVQPTCGCYHEGRIWLGGAVANRFDACVSNGIVGNTVNFSPTDQYGTVAASNAISAVLNSDSVNPIFWMMPDLQGVILGTQAGEWLVQAPTSGPISPTNITARRVTKIGCANIEPRRTEHTNVFVKRYSRKLMEYFADVYSGKFSAPNLADKAQHIPSTGMMELAYTEAVNSVIWGRNSDGSSFGISYRRDALTTSQGPTYYGWHRHALGSGRVVESICSGPSTGGDLDTLTMVTNDPATGVCHVELLTDTPDELSTLASSWFLDDAVNPTSVSISNTAGTGHPYGGLTINGLWHLNGKTVQVFAGGLDCGDPGEGKDPSDFVVANGSAFVPFGDSVSAGPGRGLFTADFANALALSQIVVGFTYNSDGQIVRLVAQADTGARNGPALGAPSRTHRAALKLVNTKGLWIGGNFDRLYPCLFKAGPDSPRDLPTLSAFSGIFYDQVKDDFTYEDSLCWRVSRPFPATVTAAGINLRTEDM